MMIPDDDILARMAYAYRNAMEDIERMRREQIVWHDQACESCGRPPGKHSPNDLPVCPKFVWGTAEFEAADLQNRKIDWLL